jgi:hypothetical protein
MQDHIDGGITLILRCPGRQVARDLTVENVPLDIYITPREHDEVGEKMTEQVVVFAQSFGQEFALPHLHRFTARCHAEGVNAPELTHEFFLLPLHNCLFIDSFLCSNQQATSNQTVLSPTS